MVETNYKFSENELISYLNTYTELIETRKLIDSGDNLGKYRGANILLGSTINKYNSLDKKVRELFYIDVDNLEKKAVEILVNQGYSKIVPEKLLKKYKNTLKK